MNWTDISDGLHISQFYSLGVSQSVQNKVITGAQDNGTFLKTNLNWDAVIGGDGMECKIDHYDDNIIYDGYFIRDEMDRQNTQVRRCLYQVDLESSFYCGQTQVNMYI